MKPRHALNEKSVANKKISFANGIIIFCVTVSAVVTMFVLWEYHRLDTVIPSGVLTTMFGMWGGELLIVALRQIFGADVTKKSSTPDHGDEENFP